MRRLLATVTIALLCCRSAHGSDIETLVPWLLQQERQLENVSFSQVLELATGHKLLPADAPQFQPLIRSIADAADQVVKQMNTPESPATSARRVNEMSRFFEDALQQALDAADNLECRFPPTADGAIQRSGYPDLQITDKTSGAVCYLDIKLHAADSRGSTFRTFYYEPKRETNKVLADAAHLILGVAHSLHDGAPPAFDRWELIDLSKLRVRLKAEFSASNRDMYRPDAVVAGGESE